MASDPQTGPALCPSAPCEPGAVLLGVFGADGRLGYVSPAVPLSEALARQMRDGDAPERRFRFAAACVEAQCVQWTGTRCGVIDRVEATAQPVEIARLPACSIRSACRWFSQSGPRACAVCPVLATDQRVG